MTPPTTRTTLFPLTQAHPGQRVRVTAVNGGREVLARLCAMGLMPGTSVDVIAVSTGPVILSVMGGRLMLGHGMAAKVLVRAVQADGM